MVLSAPVVHADDGAVNVDLDVLDVYIYEYPLYILVSFSLIVFATMQDAIQLV